MAGGGLLWWLVKPPLMTGRRIWVSESPREATAFVETYLAFGLKVLSWLRGWGSLQLLILGVGIRLESETDFPFCTGRVGVPGDRARLWSPGPTLPVSADR